MFYYRTKIFQYNRISLQFIEGVLIALKNRFLGEEETVKRAALIFVISKIYFTDELAIDIRLRITSMEWDVFSSFIEMSKLNSAYLPTYIMINHLLAQNFFKFTVKNKSLALESGSPEVDTNLQVDLVRDRLFWDDLKHELEILDKRNVIELRQVELIHNEVMKPYEDLFPQTNDLSDALEIFEQVKKEVNEPHEYDGKLLSQNLTRKEVLAVSDNFIKSQSTSAQLYRTRYEYESYDESDPDFVVSEAPSSFKKSKRTKKERKRKRNKKSEEVQKNKEESSSSSDNEDYIESRKTNRHQSVIEGVGCEKFSSRLRQCYNND